MLKHKLKTLFISFVSKARAYVIISVKNEESIQRNEHFSWRQFVHFLHKSIHAKLQTFSVQYIHSLVFFRWNYSVRASTWTKMLYLFDSACRTNWERLLLLLSLINRRGYSSILVQWVFVFVHIQCSSMKRAGHWNYATNIFLKPVINYCQLTLFRYEGSKDDLATIWCKITQLRNVCITPNIHKSIWTFFWIGSIVLRKLRCRGMWTSIKKNRHFLSTFRH